MSDDTLRGIGNALAILAIVLAVISISLEHM